MSQEKEERREDPDTREADETNGEPEDSEPQTETISAENAQKDLLYLRAEFDNYRKRILKEQDQAIRFANERLINEVLGVVDLFERALAHSKSLKSKGDKEVASFVSGIEMTHSALVQLLTRFGVEFIGTPGEHFDPVRHEAISQRDTTKDKAGTILEVHQRGCLLYGRLVTPAKVVVGAAKQDDEA